MSRREDDRSYDQSRPPVFEGPAEGHSREREIRESIRRVNDYVKWASDALDKKSDPPKR